MSHTCATCQFWHPVAPSRSDDGECEGIGASYYTKDRTIVLAGNIVRNPDRSGPRLITDANFGCVRWEAK